MNVARITPHVAAMQTPDEIRSLPGWVIWRYEGGGDATKPRKIPYYAAGGKRYGVQGRPEDRAALVTFDAACAAAARRGFDGVGLCPLPEFGIVVLDFDDAVTGRGVHAELADLVSDTYAEFSPSGNGIHAIYRGNLGDRKSHADGDRFGVETFSSKGFVTFTGNALPHVADLELVGPAVVPVSERVRALCSARFGRRPEHDDDPLMTYSPSLGLTESQMLDALAVLDPDMGHDDWLHVGMALHHETAGEGFHLWDDWSSQSEGSYPGREELSKRWESFGKASGVSVTARTLVKMARENGADINPRAVATAEDASAGPASGDAMFDIVPAWQFMGSKPLRWLLKGLLPHADVGAVYGASGAGKSFLVIDMAVHVARGVEWRGFKCKQSDVVYVAAEGAAGVMQRLRAHCLHHGYDMKDVPLMMLGKAPNILDPKQVRGLCQSIKARCSQNTRLVIIDTLAQTTPGANENSSEDMGRAMAHCQTIAQATGAMVLLVAHAGKDGDRGLRGWSGIKGALDVEILVEKEGKYHGATITKMKDGTNEGMELPFGLTTVALGEDEDGDPVSSAVLAGQTVERDKLPPKGKHQQLVLEVLAAATELAGAPTEAELKSLVIARMPEEKGGRVNRMRTNEALNNLIALGRVAIEGGRVVERA